jgi:hypothetical protein
MQSENDKPLSAVHARSGEAFGERVKLTVRVALALCAVALTAALVSLIVQHISPAVDNWGAAPGEIGQLRAAVQTVPAQIAGMALPVLQGEIRHGVDRLVDEVHGGVGKIGGQVESARLEILGPDGRFVALQEALMQRADAGLRIIEAARAEGVQPVLSAMAGSVVKIGAAADTYAALPSQLATSPAWLSLQPEITCRQLDGTGYGGCWHSRITALMGEAARVGGVFTQRFPSMADSATGIASDVRGFTHKYVDPHAMKTGDYFKAAGKITLGLGVAGLRGGVF